MTQRYEPVRREQFGDVGAEIAGFARDLVEYLSGEPEPLGDRAQGMPKTDNRALEGWLSMESVVPLLDDPDDGVLQKKGYDALLAFHIALPYNEAERQWLTQVDSASERTPDDLSRLIEGCEDRIMMAGVQQVVSGRDLMRRWTAWRRETDEFAGQGSLDKAREALQSVQALMS